MSLSNAVCVVAGNRDGDVVIERSTPRSAEAPKLLTRETLIQHFLNEMKRPVVQSSWLKVAEKNDYSVDQAQKFGYAVQ